MVGKAAIQSDIFVLTHAWRLVSVFDMKNKNPHARALGKLGGKARTEKLSPERRSEIARIAGLARSKKLSADERKRIAAIGGKASAGKPKTKRKETV